MRWKEGTSMQTVITAARLITPEESIEKPIVVVEDGFITDDDFSNFVFGNTVRLWGTQNPNFFDGTRVAGEARALLAQTQTRMAAD